MFNDILKTSTDTVHVNRKAEPDENMERMEAGYGALFGDALSESSGEQGMDTFWKIRGELSDQGYSPTSEATKYSLHDKETDNIQMGVQSMLTDFTMDAEVKANFIGSMGDANQRPESTLPTKYLREMLVAEDDAEGIPASDEYEDMRSRLSETVENVTEYRQAQQAVRDGLDLEGSQHIGTMAVDLIQMMIPFVEQSNTAEALAKVGEGSTSLKAFFLMGNAKKDFFESFKKMPLDQRISATEKFVRIIRESNKTGFITNQVLEQQMVDELLYGGVYGEGDKWVDNLVSLFDLSILGKPIGWAIKAGQKGAKVDKAVTGTEMVLSSKDMVRTNVSPVSPIRMASESNAQMSKALFNAVVSDNTDEAAGAFGGASKADVVGDAIAPEIAGKSVRSKIHNIHDVQDKAFIENVAVAEDLAFSNIGANQIKEMESATANVVLRMKEAVGVTSRNEMFQHTMTPTGAKITGVYGPENGGWRTLDDALDLTEIALREHGVTRNDMFLLKRSTNTGEYERVEEIVEGSDYLIGVDYNYRVNFSDITTWENMSVKRNFLDVVPLAADLHITRNLFDPASMFDPEVVLGANAAVDRGSKITNDFLEVGRPFSEGYAKADKETQAVMYKYILDANENQIPFNVNTLKGEYGFSPSEIQTLRSFREYWDTVWQARNITDVRAMRNDGFGVYENNKMQDRFHLRPIPRNVVNKNETIYDPLTNQALAADSAELSKIYEMGGTVGKLRKPTQLGDTVTDQVIIRDLKEFRGLRESDVLYPYQEGHFDRSYVHPHFIIETRKTDGGVEFDMAIGTAGNRTDANVWIRRMEATDGGVYKIRADLKDPKAQAEFEMDTYHSNGLSSARHRGEKLVDTTAAVRGTEDANILGPMDAIIKSSRAMGRNIAEREFIEAMKVRLIKQFSDIPPMKSGEYPTHMNEIGTVGDALELRTADARSLYEYISYLEYGYVNGMDTVYKGVLKGLARVVGDVKPRTGKVGEALTEAARSAEIALNAAGDINPTSLLKNASFQMYLATNPFRQFALNAHQSTLLTSVFTKYVLKQGLATDMHAFMYLSMGVDIPKLAVKGTGRTKAELKLMFSQWQKSGLPSSIDQNNLLRGALVDYAEASRYKGDRNPLVKGVTLSRKVGFDFGEHINLMSSWLAHYDRANTAKKGALDATDYHKISGKARNFTFNMNRAGDMAYNSNSLSLFFQYFQIPHKSLLFATNRSMSHGDRARLLTYQAIAFTLPPAAMVTLFGTILPDEEKYPEARSAVIAGLQFHVFNKIMEGMTGQPTNVDFGNLSPADSAGIYEFMHGILTTDVGAMVASSPSGQLFVDGGRINDLARSASRIMFSDPNEETNPVTLSMLYNDILSLSSGYSNYFKAKHALKYGELVNKRGEVMDASVSSSEAVLLGFGFKTITATMNAAIPMDIYEKKKEFTDDVNRWYKDYVRRLSVVGISADDEAYVIKTMAQAFSIYKNSPAALRIVTKNLERSIAKGQGAIYDAILRQADYMSPSQLRVWAEAAPDDGTGTKQDLLESINYIQKFNYPEDGK